MRADHGPNRIITRSRGIAEEPVREGRKEETDYRSDMDVHDKRTSGRFEDRHQAVPAQRLRRGNAEEPANPVKSYRRNENTRQQGGGPRRNDAETDRREQQAHVVSALFRTGGAASLTQHGCKATGRESARTTSSRSCCIRVTPSAKRQAR